MKNPEYLRRYEETEEKQKTPEAAEAKLNKQMINALNRLVPANAKYGTYKYENPNNKNEKYNVGVQKLRDGFSVLLIDPGKPDLVLKGVFQLNKKPEFFQLVTEKQKGVTKKENEKRMPSTPKAMNTFMAIIGEVNKIELAKKQGE